MLDILVVPRLLLVKTMLLQWIFSSTFHCPHPYASIPVKIIIGNENDVQRSMGIFYFNGCYGIQRVCASVWASPHPCHNCVLSNLWILHRKRVKYGELHLTFFSTGKFPIVILNFFSNFNSCKYFSLGFPGGVSGKEPNC